MADNKNQKKPGGEKFYDASFTIEALQHEPCESGFTWRSVVGAFFIDLLNALVIKFFLGLPIMQQAVSGLLIHGRPPGTLS